MDTKPLAPGTALKGKYRVTRLVAGGGMAWVYEVEEARPDGTRAVWALKELRADTDSTATLDEARRLFVHEANLLVRLDHPNLPRVVAFFEEDGRSYLIMEFVPGESLLRRLENANAPLMESQVLDWSIQVCEVLAYLHSQPRPIIFRDLKPSNIMVTPNGSVKLIDFGIARTYKAGQRRDTVTMGSENYAAPEQWGEAQTDPRADIYGLGATMYHLLTNVPPLPAFVPGTRVPLQQYNPAVTAKTAAAVERAMAREREDRFPDAHAMREALLDCLPRRERRRVEAQAEARARDRLANTPPLRAPAAPSVPEKPSAPERAPENAPDDLFVPQAAPEPEPARSRAEITTAPVTPREMAPASAAWAPTTKACPSCGTDNRPAARYCRRCGYTFVPAPPAVLRLVAPATAPWEFPLDQPVSLVGRRGGALPVDLDIAYYDPEGYVSRNHARVTFHRNLYHIVDLGSANGTFVNDQPLAPHVPRMLRQGDRVRMGQVVLEFVLR